MNLKRQIFFLHFAGGSSLSYDFLKNRLPQFDVHQLELPGRGKRTAEPLVNGISEAIQDYTKQILSRLNRQDFLIFGHSMGATLGAFVTSNLEKLNYFPRRLIVSGNAGPGVGETKKRHLLEDAAFLKELQEIGGMPASFFAHPELVEYFLPILKSDFKIVEQETNKRLLRLKTPILALMGQEEEEVEFIENWKRFTSADFYAKTFPGNHFYIHQHDQQIAQLIKQSFEVETFSPLNTQIQF